MDGDRSTAVRVRFAAHVASLILALGGALWAATFTAADHHPHGIRLVDTSDPVGDAVARIERATIPT